MTGKISAEITCKCGQQKGWVTDGEETQPCPRCGRRYRGEYDRDNLTIKAVELD